MKVIHKQDRKYLLRFEKGEELVQTLLTFCENNNIKAGWIQGLGAAEEIEISYYNLAEQRYVPRQFQDEFEIVSLTGNIAQLDEKTILHAHVVLGKKDYTTIGGHLNSLIISGTGEILLTQIDQELTRSLDSGTGLNLLDVN